MENNYLNLLDILILTIIMFGPNLFSSISYSIQMARERKIHKENSSQLENENKALEENSGADKAEIENADFSTKENIASLITQIIQLIIAFAYLYFRDFSLLNFNFQISLKSILLGILLFFLIGFIMDFFTSLKYGFSWIRDVIKNNKPIVSALEGANLPLVLSSSLNGFFEEFFFLIICTSVSPEYGILVFIYSLIIRFLIHTYQGFYTAITMSLSLGIIFFLLFTNAGDNFFIFALAHILADIFGLSFFNLL